MFIQINEDMILKVENILKVQKNIRYIYEKTESYKKWLNTNKRNILDLYFDAKYTDVVCGHVYELYINVEEGDPIEITYDTIDDLNREFGRIRDYLKDTTYNGK